MGHNYRGFRRHVADAPLPAILGIIAIGLVVGSLVGGWPQAGALAASAYFVGRVFLRPRPSWGAFVLTAAMLGACAVGVYVDHGPVAVWGSFAGFAVAYLVVAPILGRVPGKGGVIKPKAAVPPVERRPGRFPTDRRGGS